MNTSQYRIKQDIENLSQFNQTKGEGLTRLTFSKEEQQARLYIKKVMKDIGLKVYEDGATSIIGRLEGLEKDGPVVMIGSHFDSVKNGGNFDGMAGVVAGLEIIRVMKEKRLIPTYPIEIIAMTGEEGVRFGAGVFASRAMIGKVREKELETFKDDQGISMKQAMQNMGFNPSKIKEAIRDSKDMKAFLELHIEQGPVLENHQKDIGIVDCIVGMRRIDVSILGRADHAGTTPMDMRLDALDAACKVISRISDIAREVGNKSVATVGEFNVYPNATNIVPQKVRFSVDIRSKEIECIEKIQQIIKDELKQISQKTQTQYTIHTMLDVAPSNMNQTLMDKIKKHCQDLGFSSQIMLSGAGHDAMNMTQITDTAMIFVKSKDGRSHSKLEWTEYEDLQKGVEVLYETVLEIAKVQSL